MWWLDLFWQISFSEGTLHSWQKCMGYQAADPLAGLWHISAKSVFLRIPFDREHLFGTFLDIFMNVQNK